MGFEVATPNNMSGAPGPPLVSVPDGDLGINCHAVRRTPTELKLGAYPSDGDLEVVPRHHQHARSGAPTYPSPMGILEVVPPLVIHSGMALPGMPFDPTI